MTRVTSIVAGPLHPASKKLGPVCTTILEGNKGFMPSGSRILTLLASRHLEKVGSSVIPSVGLKLLLDPVVVFIVVCNEYIPHLASMS